MKERPTSEIAASPERGLQAASIFKPARMNRLILKLPTPKHAIAAFQAILVPRAASEYSSPFPPLPPVKSAFGSKQLRNQGSHSRIKSNQA
jgi:hypothetical protein